MTATKTRLAAELRAVAAKASPDNAAKYAALAARAETGVSRGESQIAVLCTFRKEVSRRIPRPSTGSTARP